MNIIHRTLDTDARLREMAHERRQDVAAVLAEAVALLDSVVDIAGSHVGEDRRRLDAYQQTRAAVPLDDVGGKLGIGQRASAPGAARSTDLSPQRGLEERSPPPFADGKPAGFAALYPPYERRAHLRLEHRLKQLLRSIQSFLREDHRFHLADGIVNHPLVLQTSKYSPIKSFPCPIAVVQGQIEQCQRGVVDFVGVEGHRKAPRRTVLLQSYSIPGRAQSLLPSLCCAVADKLSVIG
jgi:hypothetical protein